MLTALFFVSPVMASDTMLMFVGEDLEMLSLASRREEAAWTAPAIADVITKEDIDNAGDATIADLLGKSAGFYINEREQGSVPYLRGVENSTLFLYDTVPMGSSANKSHHNIDNEIFLTSIKRIEIIRGAGSVLWGPDAFAGVVNVVPLTGKDFQGIETGAGASSLDEGRSAFLKYGVDKGLWNSFVSVSAKSAREDDNKFNVVRFWNDGEKLSDPEERFGEDTPGNSQYYELYSNLSFDNWLTLSARLGDNTRAYSIADGSSKYGWGETRSNPTQTFKIEASRETGIDSGIRFMGYHTNSDLNLEIVDKEFESSEQSFYGELIYEKSTFTGSGLLTVGASQRETTFTDILVWKSFMSDYLNRSNTTDPLLDGSKTYLLPLFETEDYTNSLSSLFGQYRQRFGSLELWAGARNDGHDQYEDKASYSIGASWDFSEDLILKAIHGTAYRTPFARQVNEDVDNHLEQIKSINLQLAWKPGKDKKIAFTLFRNGIENHVIEDRYAGVGLSVPNSQTINGAELEWDLGLTDTLKISGNVTSLNNSGPDETYSYVMYDYGEDLKRFKAANYDYDPGAHTTLNLALNWRITKNLTFVPELRYLSRVQLHYLNIKGSTYPIEVRTMECPEVWLMDLHLKIMDVFPFSVDLFVQNLLDEKYKVPGVYSEMQGDSFNAGVLIKKRW